MFVNPKKEDAPPSVYRIRLSDKTNALLKQYVVYYKTKVGQEIKIDDLCSLMVETVLSKDKDFKKFVREQSEKSVGP